MDIQNKAAYIFIFIVLAQLNLSLEGQERWYMGNTHTHARFSDNHNKNDVPKIAGWYKKKGFSFLVLSEHNYNLKTKRIFSHDELNEPGKFIMINGLEMSESRHHTALGINKFLDGEGSLQDGVNNTIEAGGIPILNHPMAPVITARRFLETSGLDHIEIFNGRRKRLTARSEALWDTILSDPGGRQVYAVAADDNHFCRLCAGLGWIMVKSDTLTAGRIIDNIKKGNFYASTGVKLADYSYTDSCITVKSRNGKKIEFIGKNGTSLGMVKEREATFIPNGNELYIRTKVYGRGKKYAWTQPLFLK